MSTKATSFSYWPYDEVTLTQGQDLNQFNFGAPWIQVSVRVPAEHQPKFLQLSKKMAQNALAPNDVTSVTQIFSKVSQFPLAYILPRKFWSENLDSHLLIGDWNFDLHPDEMLKSIGLQREQSKHFLNISEIQKMTGDWKWDFESACLLSRTEDGFDANSLFSVARRFHLLDSVECNQTEQMKVYVEGLAKEDYKNAAALIVRQNHFVTEKCFVALSPALRIAQSAEEDLLEFIQAEAGHDQILGKAISSMGFEPKAVALSPTVIVLMELFQVIAKQNFLAFAMVVDMFERSAHTEQDPLAELLAHGGFETAGEQINIHKEINDSGGHENVALSFLKQMGPVDEAYARQALQLAELATNVMHNLSSDLLKTIQESIK